MSSRALRRLERSRGILPLGERQPESSDESEDSINLNPKSRFNVLLSDPEDIELVTDSGGKNDGQSEEEPNSSPEECFELNGSVSNSSASHLDEKIETLSISDRNFLKKSNCESKSASLRKKPSKTKLENNGASRTRSLGAADNSDKLLDDLLKKKLELENIEITSLSLEDDILFKVDLSKLDSRIELRRKIGFISRENTSYFSNLARNPLPFHDNDVEGPPRWALRGAQQHRTVPKTLNRIRAFFPKGTVPLIELRQSWPSISTSMLEWCIEEMHDGSAEEGRREYRLAPSSPQVIALLNDLFGYVERLDIESIYEFSRINPSNIDSLLVISDAIRTQSAADATEICEFALYLIDRCCCNLTSNFEKKDLKISSITNVPSITSGKLRLPYYEQNNRRVHLTLFRYIQALIRQGCYQTALQFAKIGWALDPSEDPLAILRLMGDFLAIQAHDYSWFEQVHGQLGSLPDVIDSPNWDFSRALLEKLRSNASLANFLLCEAINRYPWMVTCLARECGINIDESKLTLLIEKNESDYVKSAKEAVTRVYVARMGPMWKSAEICQWFESCISICLSGPNELDSKTRINWNPSLIDSLPFLRHTVISDLDRVQVAMPSSIRSILGDSMHIYDPIPPDMFISKRSMLGNCTIQ